MKTSKPKSSSQGSVSLVVMAIITMILLVAAGIFVYKYQQHAQAVAKERAEYAQAEKDLAGLSSEITQKLGAPAAQSHENSCGYTSNTNEFAAHGDLYCITSRTLYYKTADKQAAQGLLANLSNLLKQGRHFSMGASSDVLASTSSPPPTELLSWDMKDDTSLSCSATFTFDLGTNRSEGHSNFPELSSNFLAVHTSCGSRPAKAAYYPIKNP